MPSYKLTIEYDGSGFSGWQRQKDAWSIQQLLEQAIAHLAGEPVPVYVAGRTDAGVHALGQVCHVVMSKSYEGWKLREAINFYLNVYYAQYLEEFYKQRKITRDMDLTLMPGAGVTVVEAEEVSDTFHARFSAKGRRYIYKILNRRAKPAVDYRRVWHVPVPLDVEKMQEAANVLEGHHDFNAFRSVQCQSQTSWKTLDVLSLERVKDYIFIEAQSRSFLHNQVRILVGSLKLVGAGIWTREDIKRVLEGKDRTKSGPTAPAWGLYLADVFYE